MTSLEKRRQRQIRRADEANKHWLAKGRKPANSTEIGYFVLSLRQNVALGKADPAVVEYVQRYPWILGA